MENPVLKLPKELVEREVKAICKRYRIAPEEAENILQQHFQRRPDILKKILAKYPNEDITRLTIIKYLEPLLEKSIDTIILGCTHFPVVSHLIQDVVGPDITLIDSGKETAKKVFRKRIKYADSLEEALKDSECAILITEWDEFKSLTPNDFKKYMKIPNLLDGRRIYPFNKFNEELPFKAIGRQYEKKK